MSRYKAILFDLDGTLANTGPGIRNSYLHAFRTMGFPLPSQEEIANAIGAPLHDVFHKQYGMDEHITEQMVTHYRERYREKGVYEASLYEGIPKLLEMLRGDGLLLGVATLKIQPMAEESLQHMGAASCFDVICGTNHNGTLSKADLIKKCLDTLQTSPDNAILVGDSDFDAEGAALAGVDFAAVTYGFGFRSRQDALAFSPMVVVDHPLELYPFLQGVPADVG